MIDIAAVQARLSVSASAGNTTGSTPAASLGDQVSTTVITTGVTGNLWDNVTAAEATAGVTQYRCMFFVNTDDESLLDGKVTLQTQTSGGVTFAIGLDPVGVSAVGSSSAQAATIANENAAPAGVSFSTGPLSFGDLDPAEAVAVWVRRTVSAGATSGNRAPAVRVSGESLP